MRHFVRLADSKDYEGQYLRISEGKEIQSDMLEFFTRELESLWFCSYNI